MASDSIRAAMSIEQINIILSATAIIAVATAILQTSKSIHYKLQWLKCQGSRAAINDELTHVKRERDKVLADRKAVCESYVKKDRECEQLRREKSAINESCKGLQELIADMEQAYKRLLQDMKSATINPAEVDNVVQNTHEMIKSIDDTVPDIGGAKSVRCRKCTCSLFSYEPGTVGGGEEGKVNVDYLGNTRCGNGGVHEPEGMIEVDPGGTITSGNQVAVICPTCSSGKRCYVNKGRIVTAFCEDCIPF